MTDLLLYPAAWTVVVITACTAWLAIGLHYADKKDSDAPSSDGSSAPDTQTTQEKTL